MLLRGAFSPGEVAELEDHVLEESARLAEGGRSDDEAFIEATRRVGTGEELVAEFRLAHELGGASASVWLGRCVPWGLRLCRWARNLVLFCLPGLVMATPSLVMQGFTQSEWLKECPGEPVPGATALCWRVADFATSNWLWLLPLGLAVLLAPTVYRIRQARDSTDAGPATIVADELGEVQPLLLAGVVAYPLIGMGLARVFAGPWIRLLDKLGG
jgi:hypothetical protein